MDMYTYILCVFFFFKQKTAYEMRISDWSSDCALPISDGVPGTARRGAVGERDRRHSSADPERMDRRRRHAGDRGHRGRGDRKSVVKGKSVSVRVDLGGRGIIKKKKER